MFENVEIPCILETNYVHLNNSWGYKTSSGSTNCAKLAYFLGLSAYPTINKQCIRGMLVFARQLTHVLPLTTNTLINV